MKKAKPGDPENPIALYLNYAHGGYYWREKPEEAKDFQSREGAERYLEKEVLEDGADIIEQPHVVEL